MDIIFQSGEFYNESSLWTTLLGPFATLISVLISGLFGVYLFNKAINKDRELANEQREKDYEHNRELEKKRRETDLAIKEEERIKNLEKFGQHYLELLNSCINTSNQQIEEYKKYAAEFSSDLLGQHFPQQYTHENLNRLLKLDTQSILNYFELKSASNKDFINTLSQLDYLKTIFATIPNDIHEGNGKTVIELTNNLIQLRNRILQISTDYLNNQKRNNPEYEKDPLFTDLNEMVIDYHRDNDGIPSPSWDYDKLIKVIKEKFIEEPFRYIPLCNELLNLAKHGGDIVFSIRQFNEQLCKAILIAFDRINESLEKLDEIRVKINNAS